MGGGKQGVLESVFFLLAYALGGGGYCLLDVHAFLGLIRLRNNSPETLPSLPFTTVQTRAEPVKVCLHSMSLWIKWSPLIRG